MTLVFFQSLLKERASSAVISYSLHVCSHAVYSEHLSAGEYRFVIHVFGKETLRCSERDISEHLQGFDRES